MGIRDFINGLKSAKQEALITWRVDPREGVDFIMDRKVLSDPEGFAINNPYFGMQLAYLKGMVSKKCKWIHNCFC